MTEHQQGRLRTPVSDDDHSAGRADAPVTLVEYGDFQCPHCFRAHPVVMKLQDRLGDRLRFVFRNFPIAELHPYAVQAAEAAESVAARAGPPAYWRMHHAIFEHQQDSPDALVHDLHRLDCRRPPGARGRGAPAHRSRRAAGPCEQPALDGAD